MKQTSTKIIRCPTFSKQENIKHGFFTRKGGVSEGIYSSLNLGAGSNDLPYNVAQNRKIAIQSFGFKTDDLHTLYQIHSNKVIVASGKFEKRVEADALVTNTEKTVLGILTADCTPVLFADNKNKVIGAAHAGWKGAISGVLENTVRSMQELGAEKQNITATIGPTISQDSYEVGKEFFDRFIAESPDNSVFFILSANPEHYMFNLTRYVQFRLTKLGLTSISNVKNDTYSDEENFFSYRRSCHKKEPDYGRNLSVIAIDCIS